MSEESHDITPRLSALEDALDEVLRSRGRHQFTREEVNRGAQKSRPALLAIRARARFNKTHPSNVVNALAEAALNAVEEGPRAASLTWEQLQALTRLNDDDLSELLFTLQIEKKVHCRDEGDGRFYFLPARVRAKLRRKRERDMVMKERAA